MTKGRIDEGYRGPEGGLGQALFGVILLAMSAPAGAAESGEVREIGSRWELFVDDDLIDRLDGARQVLHQPIEREVAIVHDEPWEGNASLYHTVFQDGDLYAFGFSERHKR